MEIIVFLLLICLIAFILTVMNVLINKIFVYIEPKLKIEDTALVKLIPKVIYFIVAIILLMLILVNNELNIINLISELSEKMHLDYPITGNLITAILIYAVSNYFYKSIELFEIEREEKIEYINKNKLQLKYDSKKLTDDIAGKGAKEKSSKEKVKENEAKKSDEDSK